MPRTRSADVIVVGLGAIGSSTCLAVAARGISVIGIDRFRPPHPYGSTHGATRITRLALGEGPEYVPIVRRSHTLWRELEQRAGVRLLTRTGGLIIGEDDNDFLAQTRACAERYRIAHENLSNTELVRRFEMFAVGKRTEAYYEPESGYLRPEAAVTTQLELAESLGACLLTGERVREWTPTAHGVTVTTDARSYTAEQLVLCAGAWIGELFPEGVGLVAIYRQMMHWFAIDQGYERLREMPVFVWDFGGGKEDFVHFHGVYGFPALDGPDGGLKVGTETYEQTVVPDGSQHPATRREIEHFHERYLARRLPWLSSDSLRTASCLYTSTRGSRFVIDRHPAHEAVMIVSPCSGHGFKHSPAIGEAIAQRIAGQAPELDLSPFSLPAVVA